MGAEAEARNALMEPVNGVDDDMVGVAACGGGGGMTDTDDDDDDSDAVRGFGNRYVSNARQKA